jgi:hypothetical protein
MPMKEDALGGADLRRRVNGIVLPLRDEMDRGGAADGEASVFDFGGNSEG